MRVTINSIQGFIAILGPALIMSGLFSASMYYYAFGIRITDYIGFGEAFLLFIENILLILLSLSMALLPFIIFPVYSRKRPPKRMIQLFLNKRFMRLSFFCLMLTFGLLPYLLFRIFYKYYFWGLTNSISISLNIFYLSLLIVYLKYKAIYTTSVSEGEEKKKLAYQKFITFMTYVLIAYCVIFFIAAHAKRKIRNVLSGNTATEVKCYLTNNNVVSSSPDTAYLGRSVGYLFFYSRITRESIIIKSSDVNQLVIKRNPKFDASIIKWLTAYFD